MRSWMAARTDFPLIGRLFTEEWLVYLFSYGGLLLDLFALPMLLYKRTRLLALAALTIFHLMNAQLFNIGIFPWFMIAATLLFLDPGWPLSVLRRLRRAIAGTADAPVLPQSGLKPPEPARLRSGQLAVVVFLALFLGAQVLIPLRHYLYPGNVNWTEEGHRFSWRMKLRTKSGQAEFYVTDPIRQIRWQIDPADYLTPWQLSQMTPRPDMVQQFAHHLASELRKQGHERIEVRAVVRVGLNGREPSLIIDPDVDLAATPRSWRHNAWILPFSP